MDKNKKENNRFGYKVETAIPDNAPLASQPGHKLRTSNTIVDRKALTEKELTKDHDLKDSHSIEKLKGQKIEFISFDHSLRYF